jgi:hypothetical protein
MLNLLAQHKEYTSYGNKKVRARRWTLHGLAFSSLPNSPARAAREDALWVQQIAVERDAVGHDVLVERDLHTHLLSQR